MFKQKCSNHLTAKNLVETDFKASSGQPSNQLIEVLFTIAGNCLALFRRLAPTGEKQRTHFNLYRTLLMKNFQQFSFVSTKPLCFTYDIINHRHGMLQK